MSQVFRCLAIGFLCLVVQGNRSALSQIVIGAPYPQTGAYAALGGPVKVGIDRALEKWNEEISKNPLLKKNQKLVAATVDDKCESAQARVSADELVRLRPQVQVVIGHNCSGAAIEAASVYNSHGLLMISPFATNPGLTSSGHKLVFRMIGRDDDQADAAASYIASKRDYGTIAIVHDDQRYGRDLANLVRRSLEVRGIKDAMFVEVQPPKNENDLGLYDDLTKEMVRKRIDVVYYAGYPPSGVALRKKTWSDELKIPMLSGDGFLTEHYVRMVGTEAASQTFITNAPDSRTNPVAAIDMMKWESEEKPVLPQTLHAYAAVDVWVQAVKLAGTTDGAAVARVLRKEKINTVIGRISFDQQGDRSDLEPLFVWYTWRNGNYEELDPYSGKRLGLVCRVQAGLGALSYAINWTDGLDGRFTRDSIRAFYERKGKYPVRTIDEAMVSEIEELVKYESSSENKTKPQKQHFRSWGYAGLVCRAQAGLKALGNDPGNLSGKMSEKTRTAIQYFQKKYGITGTSLSVTEKLVNQIEEAVDEESRKKLALP